MTIALSAILVPNENCPVREVGTGLVIMAPAGTATHSLDEVGAFIWRQCDGRHTLAQVVEALIAAYEEWNPARRPAMCSRSWSSSSRRTWCARPDRPPAAAQPP
jgi:hypothetical protein